MISDTDNSIMFKDVIIPVEGGTSQEYIPLPDGEYSRNALLQFLADRWIPLLACHNCGRFSYCKFAQPIASHPHRGREIQCRVVLTTLNNFLEVSWPKLHTYTTEQLLHFFEGLFYFTKFIYETEVTTGRYIDREYLAWAGDDLAFREFGYIAHLRVYLDRFAAEFKE